MTLLWMIVVSLTPPALGAEPVVIAHRGQSATFPDHTLAAYREAVRLGADFLEPDLVATKDGVLVARHENEIGGTTDVADRFPDRRTTKTVDGTALTGWFTEDFTLAELKTLRARQPMDDRPKDHDGRYTIPTLAEILALREVLSTQTGRTIGVYPETKHPTYFRAAGLPLEPLLLAGLEAHDLLGADAPVYVQSFEVGNLQQLAKTTDLKLVQLVWTEGAPIDRPDLPYAQMITADGLKQVATYAAALGAHKHQVIPVVDGSLGPPTTLVADAHAAGLVVHPYTFRNEARYRPTDLDPVAEVRAYLAAGIDGMFCDDVAVGVAARTPE